jgi:hypothetical protein
MDAGHHPPRYTKSLPVKRKPLPTISVVPVPSNQLAGIPGCPSPLSTPVYGSHSHSASPSPFPSPTPGPILGPPPGYHESWRLDGGSRSPSPQPGLYYDPSGPPLPERRMDSIADSSTTSSQSDPTKPFWKTAIDETRYFAGGLISHPTESTKHFSILRHSSALVWYLGPSTSVAITIFSDRPIPRGRSIWMQRKGFSGNMGMNIAAKVGTADTWIDVTPVAVAMAANAPEAEERGWQRDMKRFVKKPPTKYAAKHAAQETHVLRIPAVAFDGYFRLLLCLMDENGKRKVLCPSPVFRVASTSTDASIVRGASLSTMPLEIGVKVASTIGTTMAKKYALPVAALVQGRAQKVQAKVVKNAAGKLVYSGLTHVAQDVQQGYNQGREGRYAPLHQGEHPTGPAFDVIGTDEGPQQPFPIKFDGIVIPGSGRSGSELGIPTANLSEVREDIRMRLGGYYFGWACILPKQGLQDVSINWHQGIIAILPPATLAAARVAAKNAVTVHMIHQFGEHTFFDAKLKVIVMGAIRPPTTFASQDAQVLAFSDDVQRALSSLERDNWGPEQTVQRMKTLKSQKSFADKYDGALDKVQRSIDKIPLHLVGVRTAGADLRDQTYGNGGYWIQR